MNFTQLNQLFILAFSRLNINNKYNNRYFYNIHQSRKYINCFVTKNSPKLLILIANKTLKCNTKLTIIFDYRNLKILKIKKIMRQYEFIKE